MRLAGKLYNPCRASIKIVGESSDLLSDLSESESENEVVIGLNQEVTDLKV